MKVENVTVDSGVKFEIVQIETNIEANEVKNEVNKQPERKPFPERYHEIYGCYKAKDYKKCLLLIDSVQSQHIEYQILKSACMIHSGEKVSESHEILDAILKERPNHVYTIYAKGLAFYHEEKWEESIEFFEKAIENNRSKADMERAEVMIERAQEKLREKLQSEELLEEIEPEPELEEQFDIKVQDKEETKRIIRHIKSVNSIRMSIKRSPTSPYITRRFGCEICNHFFGKKYNLDRHNRSIHRRSTPDNFPTKQNEASTPKPSKIVRRSIKSEPRDTTPILSPKGKTKCPICMKIFTKTSLPRHIVIHSGNKKHKCPQCPMAFFQRSDLSRHEATHSDELAFPCDSCDRRFRIKKNLQVHKRRHHTA